MFGLAGRIFGSPKALETAVGGVVKGFDSLIHTDEERANEAAAERTEARQMVVKWMESTQGQNLARRVLAFVITFVWLLKFLVAVSFSVASAFTTTYASQLMAASNMLKEASMEPPSAVMLILGFYFAAPHMTGIANAVTSRFKGDR